jgi:hypothetical protein
MSAAGTDSSKSRPFVSVSSTSSLTRSAQEGAPAPIDTPAPSTGDKVLDRRIKRSNARSNSRIRQPVSDVVHERRRAPPSSVMPHKGQAMARADLLWVEKIETACQVRRWRNSVARGGGRVAYSPPNSSINSATRSSRSMLCHASFAASTCWRRSSSASIRARQRWVPPIEYGSGMRS